MTETVLVLEAGRAEEHYWKDLWRYRELFSVLAWRDVAVRYKQTVVGIAWAVVRPFLTMAIFTVVFGRLAGLPTEGRAPYALLVFAGLLPWTLFSTSLTGAAESMVANANLIGKVYFPRLIVPVAAMVAALVDFAVSLLLLAALMFWYQFVPGWEILLLPLFVLLTMLASLGPGLWLTALNIKYRDFRVVIPFLVQIGLYIAPVGFSSSVVPESWRWLYRLNPLVALIEGFRWCILGGESEIDVPGLVLSLAIISAFLWFGIARFRATERTFADLM